MFIQESSELIQPFEDLAHRFVVPSWLHPLATAAVGGALEAVRQRSTGGSPDRAIAVWPEALRYELGPVRLRAEALAVAMRWSSLLSPELFPELFDGDLRVDRTDAARSSLTIVGTYPKNPSPSVDHDAIQAATEAWARDFLAGIARSLRDTPAS